MMNSQSVGDSDPLSSGPRRKPRALGFRGRGRLLAAMTVVSVVTGLSGLTPDQVLAGEGHAGSSYVHSEQSDCIACHKFNRTLSHPVGTPAVRSLPAGFPLPDGRLACITCHDVTPERGGGRSPVLRGGRSGTAFCAQCHDETKLAGRGAHQQGIPWAHLPAAGDARGEARHVLDIESQTCMACHDGSNASDAGAHAASRGGERNLSDHPIGAAYRNKPADSHGDAIRLVSARSLDPRIRLFANTVGCGSCHSVYSHEDNLLVMSNFQSQLCLKCHIE